MKKKCVVEKKGLKRNSRAIIMTRWKWIFTIVLKQFSVFRRKDFCSGIRLSIWSMFFSSSKLIMAIKFYTRWKPVKWKWKFRPLLYLFIGSCHRRWLIDISFYVIVCRWIWRMKIMRWMWVEVKIWYVYVSYCKWYPF